MSIQPIFLFSKICFDFPHSHVQDSKIQHFIGQLRCMGGQANMMNHSLGFHIQYILQRSIFLAGSQIGFFIQTVNKSHINVIGLQIF